jgi:resuscitation-promoting factor RpfA
MTKSFDHLLRETLKAPPPEPPDGCLDAAVLSAWFEGTLHPGERAAAEAHAADCSRCQAVLAAMIRIEPPIESRPWWRSPAFGWLVPIAVAAAALMVYVRVDRHPLSPQVAVAPAPAPAPIAPTTVPPSADQAAAEPPPQTAARDTVASTAAPTPSPPLARSKETARLEASPKRRDQAQIAVESPAAPPPAVEATPLNDRVGVPVDELTLQKAASAAAASKAPARPVSEPVPAAPRAAAPAPPTPPAEDRSKAAMAEKDTFAESVTVTRTSSVTPRQPQVVVQTADGATRWRILTPRSVQRSNDAGATWETQSTGVSAILSSGAAPSKSVCWLAGKGGVVLLSVDGRSWRQVAVPQPVDLVFVMATDASSATVTTASGRTFTTTDGGKSWK